MRCAVLLIVAACGSTSRAPTHIEPTPRGDAGVAIAPALAPSDAECRELIAHALALGVAEDREPTTAEAQAHVHASLEADFMTGCEVLAPAQIRCGMAATTLAGLAGCQASPSSSTSNSSVAPPEITPPAPRAP